MNGESWKQHARQLSAQTYALYLAYRHPRTPWYAKVFAALVVGYVFSPIDPIPDFIPGRGREARESGGSGGRSDRMAAVRSVGRLLGDARLLGRNTGSPVSEKNSSE